MKLINIKKWVVDIQNATISLLSVPTCLADLLELLKWIFKIVDIKIKRERILRAPPRQMQCGLKCLCTMEAADGLSANIYIYIYIY